MSSLSPGEGSTATLRILLLGGFRISVGARSVEDEAWRLRKAAALIKALSLANGHCLLREQIMDLLWPDLAKDAASNNLRGALHAARRTLVRLDPTSSPGWLASSDELVALCPGGNVWIDVEAFEEAAATARRERSPAAYRVAIGLYSGELLPEDRYEGWIEARRDQLRQVFLSLLVELAALHEGRGEFGSALEALGRAVAEEPRHEEAHASLMRLLALSGRRAEALSHYERLKEVLRRELAIEPGVATRRLHKEILSDRFVRDPSPPFAPFARGEATVGSSGAPNNLPARRSSFVGRERELTDVKRALFATRLLTLTGAGGSGKTRLALEAARDLLGAFPDGLWLVELARLSKGELVAQEVARALGMAEQPGRSPLDVLVDALREKRMLIVVDNCEHLIEATARVVDALLDSCPNLVVLATSREPLRLVGEITQKVPPLSWPGSSVRPPTVAELEGYESARLFIERVGEKLPGFKATPDKARAIARICRRLEGIPLAVELAAARVGTLSCEQIAARLEDSLELLQGGTRTAPSRHRKLETALGWSFGLLGEKERILFRRLSVFTGGWTLGAAESVGAAGGIEASEVLDLLCKLVDKSLVSVEGLQEGAFPRYRMLEPVRQYARERLEDSGEARETSRRHALYYLALAEVAELELTSADQVGWLERLETEHANLRAALTYSLEREDARLALGLGGALWRFWYVGGYLGEGRRWLEEALTLGEKTSGARTKVLNGAGNLAWAQGDLERAAMLHDEALVLSRRLGDKRGIATSLNGLAFVRMRDGDHEAVHALSEEALTLYRELGDEWGAARSLYVSGLATFYWGEHATARPSIEEALKLFRKVGDREGIADAQGTLGVVALSEGKYGLARSLMEEVRKLYAPIDSPSNRRGISINSGIRGDIALEEGDCEAARALYTESLAICSDLGDNWWISWCLEGLAGVAVVQGTAVRGARLFGAAGALREAIGLPRPPGFRTGYDRNVNAARALLGESTFLAAWGEGWAMDPRQAIEYALSEGGSTHVSEAVSARAAVATHRRDLTRREDEVAVLVAQGLTNRQIASNLSVSEHTVAGHVARILKKQGLSSRSALSAWVISRGIPPSGSREGCSTKTNSQF